MEKLVIIDYSDLSVHFYDIDSEANIDEDYLEELGFLDQPHVSAGRIPSAKAYRLYVDTMMEEKDREIYNLRMEKK